MKISDEVKRAIKTTPPEILERCGIIQRAARVGYICPVCGNGSGNNETGAGGTGFTFNCQNGIWLHNCAKCFQFGGDNINLLANYYNLDSRADFAEICRRAVEDLRISADYQPKYQPKKPTAVPAATNPSKAEIELAKKIRSDIEEGQANLQALPEEYRRGLTLATLSRHGCGYLPKWRHPKVKKAPPTERLIIPTSARHYNAVLPQKFRADTDKQYWKMHAGKKEIFALETITATIEQVYIFEGEIDAMSAEQAYLDRKFLQRTAEIFEAIEVENLDTGRKIPILRLPEMAFIAVLGVNSNFIDELDAHCKKLRISPLFVICFDDDDAGRTFAPKNVAELKRRGYNAAAQFLGGKSSNEN